MSAEQRRDREEADRWRWWPWLARCSVVGLCCGAVALYFGSETFHAGSARPLLPFVPFDPISYGAGLVRMPLWAFFWATLVGQFPAGMAYSYLAHQINSPRTLLVQGISVFCALILLGWCARRLLLGRGVSQAEPMEKGTGETSDTSPGG